MFSKWRKTTVGEKNEGRAKFWVCKPCKIQFKIGAEVIRRKETPKTAKEIENMLKPMQFEKTRNKQRTLSNTQLSPPNIQLAPANVKLRPSS